MLTFSDNLVFGIPSIQIGIDRFYMITVDISRIQYELALKGYFVRGGISTGLLFMDHRIVYGPALIDAHHLESTIAVYPRIVLSKNLRDLYPGDPFLMRDSDGTIFLDYLENACTEYPDSIDGWWLDWSAVDIHRILIEKRLKEFAYHPRIRSKYCWLARYHNAFCDRHKDMEDYHPSLNVDKKYIGNLD